MPAQAARRELSKHSENKWIILALLALSQFMVVLDVTVVNVALPSMARDLHFAGNNLQWVVTAYTLNIYHSWFRLCPDVASMRPGTD
jgi:hypothetical protein